MTVASRILGLSIAATVACVCTSALAQEKVIEPSLAPPAAATPERLEVGQAAPALSIEHWVKGEPVKGFEKGKVYVVEFWATWCGPCIQNIPHLTKLQKEYKDKGVTIIGVSGQDKRGIEDVRPFVEKKGKKMNYTVAVDKDMGTTRAYMMATGRSGIPVAYVVDKQGKLAWYGHPMEAMDLVIEEAAAGTFDIAKHTDRMTKYREYSAAFGKATQAKDWDAALKTLDDIKTVRPDLAKDLAISRFALTRAGKKDKVAGAEIRAQLETQFKDDTDTLRKLSEMLVGVPEQDEADQAAAVDLAKVIVVKTDGKDAQALAVLARAYQNKGDWDKALDTQKKAIEQSADEGQKTNMQAMLNQMQQDQAEAAKSKVDAPKADAPKSDK